MFLGGARGGGKTSGVLGKWALKERRYGRHFNAVMFRRTTVSAEDAIEESKHIYGPLGGVFNESKLRWRMPNGGRVGFAYLENVADADQYQGRNLTDAWVEEAGQYPESAPIMRLFGVLRSAHDVPVQLTLTGNPGGAGQHWIRDRYQLHPFPQGPQVIAQRLKNGSVHEIAVIPARITDNGYVGQDYVDSLHLVGSAALVKAWLDGDWSAVEGAFFDCWSEAKHVVSPFIVPPDWLRFRSGDWGSASPFSIGWWAVVQDDFRVEPDLERYERAHRLYDDVRRAVDADPDRVAGDDRFRPDSLAEMGRLVEGQRSTVVLPRGALIRYREWYGASAPGKGLKLTAEEVGDGIVYREKNDPHPSNKSALAYGVMDPSAFKEDGGPSIMERLNRRLTAAKMPGFREADNARVSRQQSPDKKGPMGGWDQMRARLVGEHGRPMMYFFSTCKDSIRTIPVLQHDPARAEDLDTNSEDHAADDTRYACLSRPWLKAPAKKEAPKDGYRISADELSGDSFKTM